MGHVLAPAGGVTVKTQAGNVFAKPRVENRAQAVAQAIKRGLVPLEAIEKGGGLSALH